MTKGRPASHAFVAKRGKLRRVQKKPVAKKTMDYKKIPYVRGGRDLPARGVRMERSSWKRSLPELLSASNAEIVAMLQQDGLLPEWRGKVCPHCWKGKLSSTTRYEMPHYRCTSNKCGKFVVPHYLHPLFQVSSGYTHKSLQLQAAILLLRLTGVKSAAARLLFRVNHKMYDDLVASAWSDYENAMLRARRKRSLSAIAVHGQMWKLMRPLLAVALNQGKARSAFCGSNGLDFYREANPKR